MKREKFDEISAKIKELKAYLDTVEIKEECCEPCLSRHDLNCLWNECSYINQRINDLWDAFWKHTENGHAPKLKSAEQLQKYLDLFGLNNDYVIQPQYIYSASDGQRKEVRFILTPKQKKEDKK